MANIAKLAEIAARINGHASDRARGELLAGDVSGVKVYVFRLACICGSGSQQMDCSLAGKFSITCRELPLSAS